MGKRGRRRRFLPIVLAILYLGCSRGSSDPSARLVDDYPRTDRRSTLDRSEAFSVGDVTLLGETRRAIFMQPPSRLIWHVRLPPHASLRLAMALKEDAWAQPGDGVLFRVGVSDGRSYQELLTRVVDPHGQPADRRWVPAEIDLSRYGGRDVDLVFNTNNSAPGRGDDHRADLAVWGEPTVAVR